MLAVVAGASLGVVLLWSGGAKLASPARWRAQASEFGAPARAIAPLPWVELVLGGLLVAQLARPLPAIAAGALLAVFTVGLVQRLRTGRRPPCACFGASARPISWWSVARNVLLMVVAAVAVFAV
jgi:hypothetical protein